MLNPHLPLLQIPLAALTHLIQSPTLTPTLRQHILVPTMVLVTFLVNFYDAIVAQEDEVRKAHVLQAHPYSTQIPQL